jgi:hypothetical protein
MPEQEIVILKSTKYILEYLENKYNFKLNTPRFYKLIKFHGLPVTRIETQYVARADFIDQWITDLFNNKIIRQVRAKYDLDKKPVRKGPSKFKDLTKYRYPRKKGRKKTWKEEINMKDWNFFLKKIDGVLPWYNEKHRDMVYSSAKKLLLNRCSVTLIINIIEQLMWASYREVLHAYEKEGTPYLNFRERKSYGNWKKKTRGKLTIHNEPDNREDSGIEK